MQEKIKIIVLLILTFSMNAYCQKIELEIKQVDAIEEINKIVYKNYFSDTLKINNELNKFLIHYIDKGYLSASFDTIVIDSLKYTADFHLGDVFYWSEITFNSVDIEAIRSIKVKSDKFQDSPVSVKEFSKLNKNILRYYENNGFPFVRTYLSDIDFKGDSIYGHLNIEKNDEYLIDSIIVKGNDKLTSAFICKYLGIAQGSVYNESKIVNADKKLGDLSFSKLIKPCEIKFTTGKSSLIIYSENKKANRFNGILGIVPNDKVTDKVLLTGNINLFLINSFKSGEIISFNWEKPQAYSQNLEAEFSMPFIYKSIGNENKFELQKRDTSFLKVRFNFGALFSFNGLNYAKAFYENKNSIVLSSSGLENLTVLPDYAD
ncbi:MAG: hypothetical protein ABIJ97_07810, partial [Bacteroidota bacterium]